MCFEWNKVNSIPIFTWRKSFYDIIQIYYSAGFWVPILLRINGSKATAKIWQKMKKSLVQLALNPFFGWFWIPDLSLVCTIGSISSKIVIENWILTKKKMHQFFSIFSPPPLVVWSDCLYTLFETDFVCNPHDPERG